nr:hypothetical protein [uncultured Anaerotignum sp.]
MDEMGCFTLARSTHCADPSTTPQAHEISPEQSTQTLPILFLSLSQTSLPYCRFNSTYFAAVSVVPFMP